jgi:hypothetical protein
MRFNLDMMEGTENVDWEIVPEYWTIIDPDGMEYGLLEFATRTAAEEYLAEMIRDEEIPEDEDYTVAGSDWNAPYDWVREIT